MSQNTVKARIQLKNDTESNWNKAINFIPLLGEIIIYTADESHPFSRLKVGDGITTVTDLPFIDSNTINGKSIDDLVVGKLSHSITFGANGTFVFDGSQDVIVPTYIGIII